MARPLLAAALTLAAGVASAQAPVPALRGPVTDTANLLSRADVARLEGLARGAKARDGGRGVELAYLVVPSLEGEDIEGYSIRVAEQWKLGAADRDDGLLVVVAVQDRQARIEVGQGLEGGLTDVQSSRLLRNVLAPAFQAGRYGEGLYQVGVQALAALGALPEGVAAPRPARPQTRVGSLGVLGIFVLVMLLRAFTGFGRRRRSFWWGAGLGGLGGGGFGRGGGFGGFGGGGGGWGGGGGGFSGGGASGRW